jgi:hypothetical protein
MDAHKEALPVKWTKPTTDAQKLEVALRKQYNYLRSKEAHLDAVQNFLDETGHRTRQAVALEEVLPVLNSMNDHQNCYPVAMNVCANNA